MYNLGRGMWRRVGDFERLRAPQIEKQLKIQNYLAFIEFQKEKKRQEDILYYRNSILQNKMTTEEKETELKTELVTELVLNPEPIEVNSKIDSVVSLEKTAIEDPYVKIIPKKKRNKHK